MIYVLDTDTFSAWQHGPGLVGDRLAGMPSEDTAVITVITLYEVMRGRTVWAARVGDEASHSRALTALAESYKALGSFPMLAYTRHDAERMVRLRVGRGDRGRSDLRIAAITIGAGAVLVTRNVSHFEGLPGLAVENWLDLRRR